MKKDNSGMWVYILPFILLILGFGVYYGASKEIQEFNPVTDICTKDLYGSSTEEDLYIVNILEPSVCKEWQKKIKCELNPNDEGCVCDELDEKIVCVGQYIDTREKEQVRCISKKIINCLKSHEANECEKVNPEWIWQDTRIFSVYNNQTWVSGCIESTFDFKNGSCIPDKICRIKELKDLTCEELKEEIKNPERRYCPKYQIAFACFGQWRNRYGTEKELILEFIERCGR